VLRRNRVQLLLLAANVLFWGAILVWTFVWGRTAYNPPDRLDDRAFPEAAEPICSATLDSIHALGLPTAVSSMLDRANMVDTENDDLRQMIDDLAALDRPSGDEGSWVSQWLDDWRTHIQDRQDWADDLRAGDDHPFRETVRHGSQVSKTIDNFADVNDMKSCATAGDV
jgi:hypothetical protein